MAQSSAERRLSLWCFDDVGGRGRYSVLVSRYLVCRSWLKWCTGWLQGTAHESAVLSDGESARLNLADSSKSVCSELLHDAALAGIEYEDWNLCGVHSLGEVLQPLKFAFADRDDTTEGELSVRGVADVVVRSALGYVQKLCVREMCCCSLSVHEPEIRGVREAALYFSRCVSDRTTGVAMVLKAETECSTVLEEFIDSFGCAELDETTHGRNRDVAPCKPCSFFHDVTVICVLQEAYDERGARFGVPYGSNAAQLG